MIKNTFTLPAGYKQIAKIDLMNNKRQFLVVNIGAIIIAAVMFLAALFWHPVSIKLAEGGIWLLLAKIIIFIAAVLVYMVCHELVHGFFIKLFSGKKAKYGLGLGYAFAGSEAYFNKVSYVIIALSPIVFWGLVLLILNILFPAWFWVIYGVQIINVSGAMGDFYVTYRMFCLPKAILVQDTGTAMTVFDAVEYEH